MHIALGLIGIVIIAVTILDIIWTTLGRGGGPITTRISSWLWKVALYLNQYSPSRKFLSVAGVGVILVVFTVWIYLIWIGWTLIFTMDEGSVVSTEGDEPVDIVERFYFAGSTLWTLGIGEYKPQGPVWLVAAALATTQGFFLITLSVTYLILVVSAVIEKSQLAVYISSFGKRVDDIILIAWNGKDWRILEQHLVAITPLLARLEQLYIAYPVLHYFHSTSRGSAAAPSIAALDEALTVIEYGIRKEYQPDPVALHPIRQAIWELLSTLRVDFIEPAAEAPPMPSLDRLRSSEIPTVSNEIFQTAVTNLSDRRKHLLALVENDGWSWDDVR